LDTFEVDEDEFYKYCEDPGYVRLDTEIKSIDQMVGKLRGTYPELLIANLLTNSGYQIVRLRFAPNFLSNYEDINGDLDVIGVKTDENTSEISIFESKGRARTDKDLNKELQKFSRTLRVLSQNQNALLKELGKNSSNSISVKGYFVSLADLKALDHNEDSKEKSFLYPSSFKPEVPENITLWDFNYFQNQLTANNVPEIYRNLLKNMPLAISLNLPTL
jgi:hypothetical protein